MRKTARGWPRNRSKRLAPAPGDPAMARRFQGL